MAGYLAKVVSLLDTYRYQSVLGESSLARWEMISTVQVCTKETFQGAVGRNGIFKYKEPDDFKPKDNVHQTQECYTNSPNLTGRFFFLVYEILKHGNHGYVQQGWEVLSDPLSCLTCSPAAHPHEKLEPNNAARSQSDLDPGEPCTHTPLPPPHC